MQKGEKKGDDHMCSLCNKGFTCEAREKKDPKCLCETALLYCPCPKCSAPSSTVKGIVGYICFNCHDCPYDLSDNDDDENWIDF